MNATMNRVIFRGLPGIALIGLIPIANAGSTYTWKAADDGYSGAYADRQHWNPMPGEGEWPGSGYPDVETHVGDKAFFPRVDADYVVALPPGTVTNVANFEICAQYGKSVVLDGSQTTWVMPSFDGASPYGSFLFRYGNRDSDGTPKDGGRLLFSSGSSSAARGVVRHGLVSLSSHANGCPGTLLDISGDIHWEDTQPLCPFGGETGDPDGRAEIRIRDGVVSKLPVVRMGFANLTNVLTFSNVTVTNANSVLFYPADMTMLPREAGGLFEMNVANGSYAGLSPTLGWNLSNWMGLKQSIGKTFRVNVVGGSTLAGNVSASHTGDFELNVVGAGSRLLSPSKIGETAYASSSNATMRIVVADGARYEIGASVALGADTAAKASSSSAELLVSNATFSIGGSLVVRSGKATFVDAHVPCPAYNADMTFRGGGFPGVTAELYADGADVHFNSANVSPIRTIYDFTTAKVGPKGLTLSVDVSRSFKLEQAFSDWDAPGVLTILVNADNQTMTLTAADSQESTLAIAKGRTILASGANHHSHLVVTNGAIFEVAGMTAHLRGMTLGDAATSGTVRVAPGTTLTVDGAMNFVRGSVAYVSSPAKGSVQTLFRQTAEPTEAEILYWETEAQNSLVTGLNAGLYHKFRVVKDGDAWCYTISVTDEKPSIEETRAVWAGGEGSSWTNETSWTGALPSETNVARFDGAEPKDVAIGCAVDVAGLEIAADGYALTGGRIRVSEADGAKISHSTGSATVSSVLQTSGQTPIDVAAGATLTVNGTFAGGFSKTGDGRLVMGGDANRLPCGFTLAGGWLEFSALGAFGALSGMPVSTLTEGTLEYSGEDGSADVPMMLKGAVVVKNETDLSLPVPTADSTCGMIFKRGAGRLVLAADATAECDLKDTSDASYSKGDAVDYPSDGTAPAKRGPLTVAEGEIVFRGTSGSVPTVTLGNYWTKRDVWIGVPTATHSGETGAEPGLVVDHANVVAKKVYVGSGIASDNTFAVEPYVAITNGGILKATEFVGRGNSSDLKSVLVMADAGTFAMSGSIDLNSQNSAAGTNRYVFANGSVMSGTSYSTQGPATLDFDNSVFGIADRTADRTEWTLASFSPWGLDDRYPVAFSFKNDSICSMRAVNTNAGGNRDFPLTFCFDGSEWWAGDADLVLPAPSTNMNVTVTVTGTGLKMAPPSGRTWKWIMPVVGEGGFVKDGLGTLRFEPRQYKKTAHANPITAGYEGLTDVRAGILEFAPTAIADIVGRRFRVGGTLDFGGATLSSPAFLPAGGTVRNVTCEGLGLALAEDFAPITLDAANGFSTTATRVIVDFADASADMRTDGSSFVVAHWTGTAVATLRWRGINLPEGLCATFVTDGNDVIATVGKKPGLVITVR